MRVLITGASGYLGQHLIKHLQEDASLDLTCWFGSMEGFEEHVPNARKVDLTAQDIPHDTFDVCLHLAALSSPRKCQEDPLQARAINEPKAFFDALNVSLLVFLSTDQVYDGNQPPYQDDDDVKETPLNVYAQSKLEAERYLLQQDKKRMVVVVLRCSILLGPMAPFGGAHATFLHFVQSRLGERTTFYTNERRSVLSVHDAVRVLHWFCHNQPQASVVYNMGGPKGVSRWDMAVAVAKYFGYNDDNAGFVPARKEPPFQAPLDIAMDSSKLETCVGFTFQNLSSILQQTFST